MSVNTKVNGQLVPSAGLYKKSTPMSVATCYSEDEHKIGVWVDNKPLYQSTLVVASDTTVNNTTWTAVSWDNEPSNIEHLTYGEINYDGSEYIVPNTSVQFRFNYINGHVCVAIASSSATLATGAKFTIRYTKTTDNVTVSTYAPIVPMNIASKYSEDEKVVGEWIDHKPLYQSTVNFGALPNNTSKSVAHGVANIDNIVQIDAIAINSTTHVYVAIPQISTTSLSGQFGVSADNTNVSITTGTDRTAFNGYVTIIYTKTTDTAGTGLYSDGEATLGMLGDVDLENLADGDILRYDATSGKFVNGAKTYHANWTATSSSSAGTALTESVELPKGKYLAIVRTPYSSNTTLRTYYNLVAGTTTLNSTIGDTACAYGQYTAYFELSQTSSVKFVSGSSISQTWDSEYLDRGGMDIIAL